ncbi:MULTISPECIES: flagellar basal-body MS-ring/collar protein FliF [Brevundimonas]|uniref:flagellar basal-body MS-ring/collar protein FliF n=1 Tax=Brevundimonas TaxID=41275 RepID=UPI000F022C27|nr:flagellar basal-body MS-ring/collar protein FliF [Brevundimonas lutea]
MGGFTAAIQRFGIGRLAAVLGVAAGVAAVLVAVMLRIGQQPDALLYSNLDLREAGEVTAALDQQGIKHASRGDGSTIMVHRDDVGRARMILAQGDIVSTGSVGYELFDNQSVLGQTEFQQNLNEQRALQGELERTILTMRGINSARVHVTMPRRELFQAQSAEPTAAVVVGLGARELSGDQIRAIRNVIASAVPNLKPDRVTVTDQANRTLAAGSADEGFTSGLAGQKKVEIEAQMTARIRELVEGVVGVGNARVTVAADIDTSRQTTQEQRFDPDGQVVRSSSMNNSTSQDTSGQMDGGVTATNNIPGGEQANTIPIGSTSGDNAEITNYEISNTTTTTVREPGQIQKLSVAVAVDGVLTPGADGAEATYAARPAEEIQQIEALVRAAAGIDAERGDQITVTNVRFNRDTGLAVGEDGGSSLMDFTKNDIMRGVELLVLVLTGLALIFFVVRPLLKTARGEGGMPVTHLATSPAGGPGGAPGMLAAATAGGAPLLTGPPSEMEQRLNNAHFEGEVKASSVRRVAEFVEKHPDESATILRNWVHEG